MIRQIVALEPDRVQQALGEFGGSRHFQVNGIKLCKTADKEGQRSRGQVVAWRGRCVYHFVMLSVRDIWRGQGAGERTAGTSRGCMCRTRTRK